MSDNKKINVVEDIGKGLKVNEVWTGEEIQETDDSSNTTEQTDTVKDEVKEE